MYNNVQLVPTMLDGSSKELEVKGNDQPTSNDATASSPEPKVEIKYIKEPVHVLPFTTWTGGAWDDNKKWAKRGAVLMLDSTTDIKSYFEAFWSTGTKNSHASLSADVKAQLIKEYGKTDNQYTADKIMAELYHPAVFSETFSTTDSFAQTEKAIPTTSFNNTFLRKYGTNKQHNVGGVFDTLGNTKFAVHNKRLEIAAKAALMLYHSLPYELEDEKKVLDQEREVAMKKMQEEKKISEKDAQEQYKSPEDIRDTEFDNKIKDEEQEIYNYTYDYSYWAEIALADDPNQYKKVKESYQQKVNNHTGNLNYYKSAKEVCSTLTRTHQKEVRNSNHTANLPASLDIYRWGSSYGLWGKWYNVSTGFHRGIDISFCRAYCKKEAPNAPIYSISEGVVWAKSGSAPGLTKLTIKATRPTGTEDVYITYMHANFINFKCAYKDGSTELLEGDVIHMGTCLGTESDNGAAEAPHTHIEINTTYPPHSSSYNPADKGGSSTESFLQAFSPTEPIYSVEPYAYIEKCYSYFHNLIVLGEGQKD